MKLAQTEEEKAEKNKELTILNQRFDKLKETN